jgi:hypothetical protein
MKYKNSFVNEPFENSLIPITKSLFHAILSLITIMLITCKMHIGERIWICVRWMNKCFSVNMKYNLKI